MTDDEMMNTVLENTIPEPRASKAKRLYVELDMLLPPGKTCADCKHVHRCIAFGVTRPERETCDFGPSRFILNDKE